MERQMRAVALLVLWLGCGACVPSQPSDTRETALISLGRQIFHDTSLSSDRAVSCASCHQPNRAFSDGRAVAVGAHGRQGTRNAPSLIDVRLMSTFFWDGRASDLEDVVLQPFTSSVEMGLQDSNELVRRILENGEYREPTRQAFDGKPITASGVGTALAAYLRSIPLGTTRYERYAVAQTTNALDSDERAGLALFLGKAECGDCHQVSGTPAPFSDNRAHHAGIGFDKIAGKVTSMVARLEAEDRDDRPLGQLILEDQQIAELGRFAATRNPNDLGAFRTPSLRNVALTAPYMHDGSVPTLPAAVEREIYYRGLANGRPIALTVVEQKQLLAFLQSLTSIPE